MKNKTQTIKLNDLVKNVTRGLSSYYITKSEEGTKVPMINIKDISDGKVHASKVETTTIDSKHTIPKLTPGDVLICIKGSIFKVALVDEKIKEYTISSNLISLTLNDEIVMPELMVAYLNSSVGQAALQNLSVGAVQKSIRVKSLLELSIPLPSLSLQQELSNLITTISDYNEVLKRKIIVQEKIIEGILQNTLLGDAR